MTALRVLVADDDPVSRRLLDSYLQKWEYDVVVAENGTEAWELFQKEEFPMVICDWMMPGIDGPDLIRRIRARTKSGYVYTVLLTAKSKKGDLVTGMESGADDFVSKPFDHDELHVRLRAGERIIKLQRSLREAEEELGKLRG
ncbi:MAG: response regulator [Pirellulaceae bacterium]|nr:response regulator [Pirellulaceae bacterium]